MKDLGWLYSKNTFFCQILFPHIFPTATKEASKNEHVFLCNYQRAAFSICVWVYVCVFPNHAHVLCSFPKSRKKNIHRNHGKSERWKKFWNFSSSRSMELQTVKQYGQSQQQIHSNIIILSGPLASFPSHHTLLIEIFKIKF